MKRTTVVILAALALTLGACKKQNETNVTEEATPAATPAPAPAAMPESAAATPATTTTVTTTTTTETMKPMADTGKAAKKAKK
jgi:hypothetical protein